MLGYPPEHTSVLPYRDGFNPGDWVILPKYGGWRAVIHENRVYNRQGTLLPIKVGYPTGFDYQLDSKITNPEGRRVLAAIRKGTQKINIFDIYLPSAKNMVLLERMEFLKKELGIAVQYLDLHSYDNIFSYVKRFQQYGYKGLVLKRKDGIYRISNDHIITDDDWIRVE